MIFNFSAVKFTAKIKEYMYKAAILSNLFRIFLKAFFIQHTLYVAKKSRMTPKKGQN